MQDIHKVMKLIPSNNHESIEVYAVKNPDGTIRWIWPVQLKKPEFLRFYNACPPKAAIYVFLIKLIFSLRLQSWIFNKQKVNVPANLGKKWALFTGTKGLHQKIVIFNGNAFIKIPVGRKAKVSLQNEKAVLSDLSSKEFKKLDLPTPLDDHLFAFSQTSFDHKQSRLSKFTSLHSHAIKEIFNNGFEKMELKNHKHFKSLEVSLASLKYNDKMPQGLNKKLIRLFHQINQNIVTDYGYAHGDFTSWNMFNNDDQLFIYDWEASHPFMPKGFDAFHFIIQQGILVERISWSEIYADLTEKLVNGGYFLFASKEEMNHYLKLYILHHVDRSMSDYVQQVVWHTQIYWMIDIWNAALDALITDTAARTLFVSSFFDHLEPYHYAGLKISNTDPIFWKINSDIDLLINQKDLVHAIQFCKKYPLTAKVSMTTKSFMTNLSIFFKDGSFLSLDLIYQLKRKTQIFMDSEGVLKRSKVNDFGIKTVSPKDEAKYIGWFYALNNTGIPDQYKFLYEHLLSSNSVENKALLRYFKEDVHVIKELKSMVKNKAENLGWSGLKNKAFYCLDYLRSFLRTDGLVITFSGVDGAGKSTIIENIKYKIEKNLRKEVVVIRHRPSILPIISALKHGKKKAEAISVSNLPRKGNNKSLLSSILRFGYYFTDYIFGQFYIYFKYVLRGKVVLYDRYYFDFINDGKRSNIDLPASWVKLGYRFLLKPDLNYFLYADANTIISRKQELDINTIESLTADYKNLFAAFSKTYDKSAYFSIKNEIMDETLSILLSNIKSKIARA